MADSQKNRKRLDDALNRIPEDVLAAGDKIAVSWPIAAYTVSTGSITIHDALRGTRCVAGRILDVGGSGITAANGVATISLNQFHCLDSAPTAGGNTLGYDHPINVVATAREGTPATLTVKSSIGPGANNRPEDVTITVSAWDSDSKPVGGVGFNWRCLVPITSIIG